MNGSLDGINGSIINIPYRLDIRALEKNELLNSTLSKIRNSEKMRALEYYDL